MSKPGAYTLEIRTSMGHYIRTESYATFSRLLEAVKRQPATRHLYAYNDNLHDYDTSGLTEEQQDLLMEAESIRT